MRNLADRLIFGDVATGFQGIFAPVDKQKIGASTWYGEGSPSIVQSVSCHSIRRGIAIASDTEREFGSIL